MHGLSPESICEREAGSLLSQAIILAELAGTAEAVAAEYEYDATAEGQTLVRLCKALGAHLDRLSLAPNGALTLYRECARCSGNGKTTGEDPCIECDGSGHVHADQADG